MIDYLNVPPNIAAVISSRLATLIELQTTYGLEDLCNLLEIISVNNYNERKLNKTD